MEALALINGISSIFHNLCYSKWMEGRFEIIVFSFRSVWENTVLILCMYTLQWRQEWAWSVGLSEERHLGGAPPSATPHSHPKVPNKREHRAVVPHIHMGSDLCQVCGPCVAYEREREREREIGVGRKCRHNIRNNWDVQALGIIWE